MPSKVHDGLAWRVCSLPFAALFPHIHRLNPYPSYYWAFQFGGTWRRRSVSCRLYHVFQLPTQRRKYHRFHKYFGSDFGQLRQSNDHSSQWVADHSVQIRISGYADHVHRKLFWSVPEQFSAKCCHMRHYRHSIDYFFAKNKKPIQVKLRQRDQINFAAQIKKSQKSITYH
jgi:hypothetical protein